MELWNLWNTETKVRGPNYKLSAAAAAAVASPVQHCDQILSVLHVHKTNLYGQGPSNSS